MPSKILSVSIRAPELSPGRPAVFATPKAVVVFQSAPRSYPRGDSVDPSKMLSTLKFQSAPRSYPRGDKSAGSLTRTFCSFNPRPGAIPGAT